MVKHERKIFRHIKVLVLANLLIWNCYLLGLILHELNFLNHFFDFVSEDAKKRELDKGHDAEADDEESVPARLDPGSQGHDTAGVVVPVRSQRRIGAPLALLSISSTFYKELLRQSPKNKNSNYKQRKSSLPYFFRNLQVLFSEKTIY